MAVEKPVAGVDLTGTEPRVPLDPQTPGNGLIVGGLVGVGERERKEVPDPCGVPVDLVYTRRDGVERRGPVDVGELSEGHAAVDSVLQVRAVNVA